MCRSFVDFSISSINHRSRLRMSTRNSKAGTHKGSRLCALLLIWTAARGFSSATTAVYASFSKTNAYQAGKKQLGLWIPTGRAETGVSGWFTLGSQKNNPSCSIDLNWLSSQVAETKNHLNLTIASAWFRMPNSHSKFRILGSFWSKVKIIESRSNHLSGDFAFYPDASNIFFLNYWTQQMTVFSNHHLQLNKTSDIKIFL